MMEVNYDERWKVARDLACKINLWPTVENLQQIDAALRRAKVEGALVCERERDELSKDLEEVRKQLAGYKDQHRRDREYIERLQNELGHGKDEVVR